MKLLVALLAFVATSFAQYYNNSSPDFRLILKSDNSTLNGTALGACHEGAAIEGLCITSERYTDPPSHSTTFNFNTTGSDAPTKPDTYGVLYWILIGSGFTAPSAMKFSYDPNSNLAIPLFFPGYDDYVLVSFESCGSMYIPRDIDDTVTPPAYTPTTQKIKNWYICVTRYGYVYTTLAWKIGVTGTPQNPSCQKVDVIRVYN